MTLKELQELRSKFWDMNDDVSGWLVTALIGRRIGTDPTTDIERALYLLKQEKRDA